MPSRSDKPGPGPKPAFGRLRPPARPSFAPQADTTRRKRTVAIALVMLGTGAVGALALNNSRSCQQPNPGQINPGQPTQAPQNCGSRWWGHSHSSSVGFYSGSSQTSVQRGGFGQTGHTVSARGGS